MSGTAQLPRPGDMIAGKYVLDRLLGQGGMGAVFAARHLKLAKQVAIKIMLADTSNPEAAQRFINEGRAAANIQNEHVVRVDDVDEEMGYAYMVLELLEGEDLSQILEREPTKRIAPHLAVAYVLQACRGVAQAHAIGIVHRDLKPSNLFLAKRKDGTAVVKVLDFGISKAQGSSALAASPNALTSTKAMLGSPLYMSPEQLRNAKGVDHRADIWALGVILYELITGALPFMGENLGELFAAILETDPLPLRQRVEGVPPGLDEVVLHCLHRKPEGRFQTVAELATALSSFERPMPMAIGGPKGASGTAFMPVGPPGNYPPPGSAPHPMSPTGPHAAPGAMAQMAQTPPNAAMRQSAPGSGMMPPAILAQSSSGQAMPPGFQATTGSGWQTPGSAPGVPKSKAPLIAGAVLGVLALVGVVAIVLALRSKHPDHETAEVAKSGTPPPSAVSLTAPVPPPPESVAMPIPSASVPPVESAVPPTPPAVSVALPTPPPVARPGVMPAPPTPPKAPVVTPPAPPTPPKPTAPKTPGTLENAR